MEKGGKGMTEGGNSPTGIGMFIDILSKMGVGQNARPVVSDGWTGSFQDLIIQLFLTFTCI